MEPEPTRSDRVEPTGIERFELLKALGSGAMGTVFEARDRRTGQKIAIKALHDGAGSVLYQFKREFRVLSELSHPFLVKFGELFEDAGRFYLTMELVEGDSFLDYVRPGATNGRTVAIDGSRHDGILDVERLRRALAQLASGLMALHASGVVHRDIKPQNVLVSHERVVVLDFGLALTDEDRSELPELAGTVAYMAPEQLRGVAVSEAADWYAVGVVLYQALTGVLPNAGAAPWSASRRLQPSLPDVAPGAPALPDDLRAICLGLLAPDPAGRLDGDGIARLLGMDVQAERGRAGFRSQLHFARSVFINRQPEFDVLRAALEQARLGDCRVVRVVGESGVGKTALLRRWLADVASENGGPIVLSSRCYEGETLPYRGVDGIVDAAARHLAEASYRQQPVSLPGDAPLLGHVFPVLRAFPEFDLAPASTLLREDPQEARRLAFSAFRDLLAGLTEHRPLVLHVDDAQWIDSESIALLSFLATAASPLRMLVVLAERPGAASASEALLGVVQGGTTLELGPLDAKDSEQLASELLRRRGRTASRFPQSESVARTSGGHPLFIHELVLSDDPAAAPGRSLEAALSLRLDRLSEPCRRLLEVLAIASSPVPHDVARPAAGLEPSLYPQVVSALRSENLASFPGLSGQAHVHISHDRIRELVFASMAEARRRDGHLRVGRAMETVAPQDLDPLAHHFFEAGVMDKAARYAQRAAERALSKLAFDHAVRFFELALRAESEPRQRAILEERLGQAQSDAGRGTDAAEAFLRAAALLQGSDAKALRRRAGEQLLRSGHVERGVAILSEILRELGVSVPRTDLETASSLARALLRLNLRLLRRGLRFTPRAPQTLTPEQRLLLDACWTMATGLSMVHHLRATDFQARSLLLALDLGAADRVLRSSALLSVSLSADAIGRGIGRRLMEGARQLAESAPTAETHAWLALTTGAAAMGDWNFSRCVESCGQAEVEFRTRCTGAAWEVVTAQAFALWSMAFQGRLGEAGERLPALLASARARGDLHAQATLALSPLHLVGLAADASAQVREQCTDIVREWPEDWACFQHMCAAYVLAHVELYEGREPQAWTQALRAWEMLRHSHLSRVQFQRVDLLGLRGRAALSCAASGGEPRAWIERARADVGRLRRVKIDSAQGMASLLEGCALTIEGRGGDVSGRFEDAATSFSACGMQLHSAFARVGAGIVRRDAVMRDAATRELTALGVVDLRRMMRLWLPGRWSLDG